MKKTILRQCKKIVLMAMDSKKGCSNLEMIEHESENMFTITCYQASLILSDSLEEQIKIFTKIYSSDKPYFSDLKPETQNKKILTRINYAKMIIDYL